VHKKLITSTLAAALTLIGLLSLPPASVAQEEESQANTPTRRTPAMRERVYQRLAEAQECAETDDMPCANRLLNEVREMSDLNSYERAQMWNFFAFIYFNQDNYAEAIRAYENVLQQEELPIALETTTLYSLATLYVQQEQFQEGLDTLEKWFVMSPDSAPEPYILKAQIHYQMQQYREGIEPVMTALEVAERQGKPPQEGWYQLLNVFYFELEQYQDVIRTLTTLVEGWPKKDYLVQLAGIYGQEGNEEEQLALYEAAYDFGWLERSTEFVNLAQMLLQAEIPYKAGSILENGLADGTIDSTEQNWRLLSQAWQLAQEDEKALPALTRASSLAEDGELDMRLAMSYANLARWEECSEAARDAIRRGGLNREDQANLTLGNCLVEQKEYAAARNAFRAASSDQRSRSAAQQWLQYIESEVAREDQIAAALRR